jgi:TonB-dependent starch-binding outer membrane protein SusC
MYISTRKPSNGEAKIIVRIVGAVATPKPRTFAPSSTFVRAVKLTAVILLICFLQVSAHSSAQQRISISLKSAALDKVFAEIEKRSGYTIFYNTEVLKSAGLVTIEIKDASVEDVLRQCLKGLPLEFTVQDKTIFVKKEARRTAMEMERSTAPSAAGVSGVVRSEAGVPLGGATVSIKKLKKQGQTNVAGEFVLKGVPNGTYEVEVSFVGYEKYVTTITVDNKLAVVTVAMKQSQSSLDEMVVKGYYTTTNRLNTGDVTTVKGEEIQKQPVQDPILALEGRVPGLYIQQTSGAPGAYSTIRIMGQNSMANGNDPLYIVDGVPFSSISLSSIDMSAGALGYSSPVSNVSGGGMSPFNGLNPSDIESIEVLKDADATAIYGSRGANGVILITTKKGKSGDTHFNMNVYTGGGYVTRMMHLLNTPQYLTMRHEAFQNDNLPRPSITTTPTDRNYDVNGIWDTTRYTNWQKVFIGNTANFTNAQGSFSGGNANTQFVVGGGYSKQGTAFLGDYSDQKASGHVNLTHTSTDRRFRLQMGANYVNDNSTLPPLDFTSYIDLAPDAPSLYDGNGNVNWAIHNGTATFGNNLAGASLRSVNSNTSNLISNLNLGYQLFKGLQIKTEFGYNKEEMNETSIIPASSYAPPNNVNPNLRSITFATTTFTTWIVEPQIDYQKVIGFGKFETLVGTTFQENKQNSLTQYASGYTGDALITNPLNASTELIVGDESTLYRYNAIYGRLSYNWADKYLINLTARRDGSSRFGPGKQFGNFGAAGVGWVFTKENLIQNDFSILSFGKLKASYGVTGNDQITDYQFLSTYSSLSYTYQGIAGLYPTSLTNPYFAWEVVKKLEGGIDLGFVKDRILLSAIYYRNRTGNQLVGYSLPSVTGFSSVQFNLPAVVQNTGLEVTLNTINIKSKKFSWSTSANLTVPSNKLVSFPNISNFGSYANRYVVGKSLFIQERYYSTGVNPQSGLYSFATKNPNGIPSTPQDLQVTRPVTQKYYGGVQNNLSYGGFQLDVFIQYVNQLGYDYKNYFPSPGTVDINQPTAALNRWTSPGELTSTQRFGTTTKTSSQYNLFRASDGVITGASFLRIKNLSFSYNLPERWDRKVFLASARIYVQCQNLITITKYVGLDPETGGLNLPPLRMITAGIQVGL